MIKRLTIGCLLAICSTVCVASDYAVTITWVPNAGETVQGFRVYEYTNGERILRYEGTDTVYAQNQRTPTVFGVVAYNENGESDVIPRYVHIPQNRPGIIEYKAIVEKIPSERGD